MTSTSPPSGSATTPAGRKPLGFFANAMKRKHSFVQFFAMTGILLLSIRSLGQKYRIHDLEEDMFALREEQEGLKTRMNHIKQSLLAEAALEPSGLFASRLRVLFGRFLYVSHILRTLNSISSQLLTNYAYICKSMVDVIW